MTVTMIVVAAVAVAACGCDVGAFPTYPTNLALVYPESCDDLTKGSLTDGKFDRVASKPPSTRGASTSFE